MSLGDLFTYARGKETSKENNALLISDPISCQSNEGKLTFWYWKTALNPSLRVCIRKPPGPNGHVTCIAHIHGLHRQEWIQETTKIPKSTEPFEVMSLVLICNTPVSNLSTFSLYSKLDFNTISIRLDLIKSCTRRICAVKLKVLQDNLSGSSKAHLNLRSGRNERKRRICLPCHRLCFRQ